jgi:poly(3-hydroxybutyrate) depolymerase
MISAVTEDGVTAGRLEMKMDEGSGSFVFRDRAAGARQSIRVFYFRPPSLGPDFPLVVAMHGSTRAGAEFRDWLLGPAQRLGFLLLVPEFDVEAFPNAHAYNYGNVTTAPPDSHAIPRRDWNFGITERLVDSVSESIGSPTKSFHMFGMSAGAKYVLRYLAVNEAPFVGRAVAANGGWYMLPDLNIDYPDGMGGIGLDESFLRRYLSKNLTILLGDADTDPDAPDLPRNETAVAQGPHRLARGLWHFDHCRKVAERLRTSFGWRLEIVPGAVHVDQAMFEIGSQIVVGSEDRASWARIERKKLWPLAE